MGELDPTQNPGGIGHTVGDRRQMDDAQRLQTLLAQLDDPARDPASTPELQREIARMQRTVAATAPGAVRTVAFEGKQHAFPADATDEEVAQALETLYPAPPRPAQADVRAAEPKLSPGQTQDMRLAAFDKATKDYIKATGGTIPPGKNIRQAISEWSGVADPQQTSDQAMIDELAAGGDLRYGDSVPYVASKALAAVGGFARGGPAGATAAETVVRQTSLVFNLKKAVDAGAIDKDRAAEIFARESVKGAAEDAAFNFGLPILAQIVKRVPGTQWLYDKVAALVNKQFGGGMTTAAQEATAQRGRAVDKLAAQAPTPAAQQAVRELGQRTEGTIPTPGQVTGDASRVEAAARVVDPAKFDKANQQLSTAVEGMRQEVVNPSTQPSRQALGEQITKAAEDLQKNVKTRLRPTFEEANKLGVAVSLTDVVKVAEDALARNGKVPGGQLKPGELTKLRQIVDDLRVPAQPGAPGAPSAVLGPNGVPAFTGPVTAAVPPSVKPIDAEAALDFLSARKADTRAITADGVPSTPFVRLLNTMVRKGEKSYQQAAAGAGNSDIVKRLIQARADYSGMMDVVYDDAMKIALKKNPEDVGRLFWQAGNVSEIQQLHKMLQMATKESALTGAGATKLQGAMVRGFLAEAIPDVGAAAKWSETLSAKPGLRDTWHTLTATPGGPELRATVEVLEQAARMAQREHKDLMGSLGLAAIPISRVTGGGVGLSLVTGAFHPAIAIAGLSIDGLLRMAATAYTQGNKGVLNTVARALRANSAGTAAGAKALQEALPEIEKFAAANNITDIFVPAAQKQQ